MAEVLRKRLEKGDLPFREFMETALYHPEFGYYSRGGQRADYITSPSLSPLFSYAIGRLVNEFLGRSGDAVTSIVDIGCGTGELIGALPGGRRFGIDRTLARVTDTQGVTFGTSLDVIPREGAHFIVSNELFDAFPFARLVQRGRELHELCVTQRPLTPASRTLSPQAGRGGIDVPPRPAERGEELHELSVTQRPLTPASRTLSPQAGRGGTDVPSRPAERGKELHEVGVTQRPLTPASRISPQAGRGGTDVPPRPAERGEGGAERRVRGLELDWSERPAPSEYTDYFIKPLADGQFADISLDWGAFYDRVARLVTRGMIVTFDYGFRERQLFDIRIRKYGTAAAYRGHRVTRDLLASPGGQDLTAHINFSDLERAGERHGFATRFFGSQAKFLLSIGAAEHPLFGQPENLSTLEEALAVRERREEARRLVLPDGIGEDIRVLVQIKGLEGEWPFGQ